MTTVKVDIDAKSIIGALNSASRLGKSIRNQAGRELAEVLQRQMRQRISKTKESPDGEPWKEWSTGYAKTRTAEHSLMIATRKMLRAFKVKSRGGDFKLSGTEYTEYANDERPFIGIGEDDRPELQQVLNRWAQKLAFRGGI